MSTITFSCYSCGQVLKVGAGTAGKKAKCVKCGTILTIPMSDEPAAAAAPAPAPPPPARNEEIEEDRGPRRKPRDEFEFEEDDRPRKRRRDEEDDDEPRRRRRDDEDDYDRPRKRRRDEEDDDDYDRPRRRSRDEDEDDDDYDRPRKRKGSKWGSWPKFRIGMLVEVITAGIYIGSSGFMLLTVLLFWFAFMARSMGMLDIVKITVYIGVLTYWILQIPAVVGYVFSLFAPNKNGSLALSITTLSLGGVAFILKTVFVLIPLLQVGAGGVAGGPPPPMPFSPTSTAAAIMILIFFILLLDAEYVLFAISLRSAAMTLKDRRLKNGWMAPLIMTSVATGIKIVVVIIFASMAAGAGGPGSGEGTLHFLMIVLMAIFGACLAYGIVNLRYVNEFRQSV